MKPYPAKRYHPVAEPVYVQSAAEDAALGPDWYDSPKKARDARGARVKKAKAAEPEG